MTSAWFDCNIAISMHEVAPPRCFRSGAPAATDLVESLRSLFLFPTSRVGARAQAHYARPATALSIECRSVMSFFVNAATRWRRRRLPLRQRV